MRDVAGKVLTHTHQTAKLGTFAIIHISRRQLSAGFYLQPSETRQALKRAHRQRSELGVIEEPARHTHGSPLSDSALTHTHLDPSDQYLL